MFKIGEVCFLRSGNTRLHVCVLSVGSNPDGTLFYTVLGGLGLVAKRVPESFLEACK